MANHTFSVSFAEFVWIWNRLHGFATPELHLTISRWLEEASSTPEGAELLLMAFRNSGKSTLVGLFSAWRLMVAPDTRILVLAADLDLSKKMVRTVKGIIERHPLCRGLKPDKPEQWGSESFTVARPSRLRDPSMLARGISANITGSRADLVICDDVEVPNTCDTASKRTDLRRRLDEIAYILVPGGVQLYVGTPHTHESIYLDDLEQGPGYLSGFERLVLPIVNEEGLSAWPERFPPPAIEAIRRRTGPNKFRSQMLLEPVPLAEGRLPLNMLGRYDGELNLGGANGEEKLLLAGRRLVSASCWWDPAYGAPEGGDGSVVAALFTDEAGSYWLHRLSYLTFDPSRLAEEDAASQMCRQVAEFTRGLHLPSVRVETNGIGRFLPGILRREMKRAGSTSAVIEVASRRPKDERILEAFDAVLNAGSLRAHDSVWTTRFIDEMRDWRPGGGGRDDGLDAVAGCLLSEPVRLPRVLSGGGGVNWRPGGGKFTARSDFSV